MPRLQLLLLVLIGYVPIARAAEPLLTATAVIRGDQDGGHISRRLYGHFAEHLGRCIYDGIWVGPDSNIPNTRGIRNDIIDALKRLQIPVLRWPGGCFADDYHWRDGIGPPDQRPKRVNIHWGNVVETNAFGTHEFLDLCDLIGAEPYLAGNVGSGSPQEMRDWIEYLTYDGDSELANLRRKNGRDKPWRIEFFGVGNENWGCGGNMQPEYYADVYRQFATFCRDYSGNRLTRVACGPNGADNNWTTVLMERAAGHMQALSLHNYTLAAPWDDKLPATGFGEAEWFAILHDGLRMERILRETEAIMDRFDPDKRVSLFVDEWGTWYRNERGTPGYALYQQNTLRDALLAAQTFHIFHEHCERVRMANIAQTVNVLQAMILTDGEKMLLTPTYHVFEMYKVHHDATRLPVVLNSPEYKFRERTMPALSASASRDKEGRVHVSIINSHATQPIKLSCELPGVEAHAVTGRVLTADKLDAHTTFDLPETVKPRAFDSANLEGEKLQATIPAHSITVLELTP
jgi:alpha-N-arabinofuranosidase